MDQVLRGRGRTNQNRYGVRREVIFASGEAIEAMPEM